MSKNDPCSQSMPNHTQIQQHDAKKIQTLTPAVKIEQTKKANAAFETTPKEENRSDKTEDEEKEVDGKKNKKEVFVIQHRKSNDKQNGGVGVDYSDGSASNSSGERNGSESEEAGRNIMAAAASGQAVRTSSCTKEEVDAILIQCGRLSRSCSGKGNVGHGRRYSGSKRSFDFDRENEIVDESGKGVEAEEEERTRRRQSRGSQRRRTPSRSREREEQQQRSGSRERSQSNGRRVSRSPNRRSQSPITRSGNGNSKPGKLVSVPATVSSLSVEKTSNGNGDVKRVLVKRNVGSPRSQSPARAVSPARAHSPARGGANHGNGNVGGQATLSRNGSRKAEHSPYRRTPLNEIDVNSLPFNPLSNKRQVQKGKEIEEDGVVVVKHSNISGSQVLVFPLYSFILLDFVEFLISVSGC